MMTNDIGKTAIERSKRNGDDVNIQIFFDYFFSLYK
jgi:hypothetical protein